ncbi:unnamed protein product, partial [Musa acuminata subsp. burmannicoides]
RTVPVVQVGRSRCPHCQTSLLPIEVIHPPGFQVWLKGGCFCPFEELLASCCNRKAWRWR